MSGILETEMEDVVLVKNKAHHKGRLMGLQIAVTMPVFRRANMDATSQNRSHLALSFEMNIIRMSVRVLTR